MVTKLISIFTVAGVVAAGSVAYALNAQTLNGGQTSKVDTSTTDSPKKRVTDPTSVTAGNSESQSSAGDAIGISPVPNTRVKSGGQEFPPRGSDEHTFVPNTDPTIDPAPVATPTATDGPVLPPPPPGFKPGQGDDGDDEGEDDNEFEDRDDQDSHDGQSSWEYDD